MKNYEVSARIFPIGFIPYFWSSEYLYFMLVYLNDKFTEWEKASLHISDLAIQRGYGIFDFFRVRDNVPLFVEDHLDRFIRSANIMHLTAPYSKEKLQAILRDLLKENNMPHSGIRMILTGGYSPDAYQPVTPNFIIMQSPLMIPDTTTPKSISIITHEFVRDIPEAKTINYTMGIWLQKKLTEQQADDVLYHTNGIVTEFPRCNFFIVNQDNTIITPDKNALKGVTRKRILELGAKQFQIMEGTVTLDDIAQAKEAFLSSSTKRIQAIEKIDGKIVGDGRPGKVTSSLLNILQKAESEYVANALKGEKP
jgi:D-alanine transaminase/branched-chain amino acid aminotransferase